MVKEKVEEKILKTIIASPKTTSQIAKILDYVDGKKVKYNNVATYLKRLESQGYLQSTEQRGKHGPPATVYELVNDITIFKRILEIYPSLTINLQENKQVQLLLAEKLSRVISPDIIPIEILLNYIRNSETLLKECVLKEPPDLRDSFDLTFASFNLLLHSNTMGKTTISLFAYLISDFLQGKGNINKLKYFIAVAKRHGGNTEDLKLLDKEFRMIAKTFLAIRTV